MLDQGGRQLFSVLFLLLMAIFHGGPFGLQGKLRVVDEGEWPRVDYDGIMLLAFPSRTVLLAAEEYFAIVVLFKRAIAKVVLLDLLLHSLSLLEDQRGRRVLLKSGQLVFIPLGGQLSWRCFNSQFNFGEVQLASLGH
jgi:hypothetical protein